MKNVLRLLSFLALAVMLLASVLLFRGAISEGAYHAAALTCTVVWFVAAPFWMKRRLHQSE